MFDPYLHVKTERAFVARLKTCFPERMSWGAFEGDSLDPRLLGMGRAVALAEAKYRKVGLGVTVGATPRRALERPYYVLHLRRAEHAVALAVVEANFLGLALSAAHSASERALGLAAVCISLRAAQVALGDFDAARQFAPRDRGYLNRDWIADARGLAALASRREAELMALLTDDAEAKAAFWKMAFAGVVALSLAGHPIPTEILRGVGIPA